MGADVHSRRCAACPQTFKLATLMSKTEYCPACDRKRADAIMEARANETSRVYDPATEYAGNIYVKGGKGDPSLSDRCAVGVARPISNGDVRITPKQPGAVPLTVTSDGGRGESVVWQDVNLKHGWGCCNVMFAAMPDGRALVAGWSWDGERYGWGVWPVGTTIDHHPYDTATVNGAAASREAAKDAAVAKWRELSGGKPAAGKVDVVRDPVPAMPMTYGECHALLDAGWWLQNDSGSTWRKLNGQHQMKRDRYWEPFDRNERSTAHAHNSGYKPIRPESA